MLKSAFRRDKRPMNPLGARAQRHHRTYGPLLIGAVVLGLVGLAGRGLARPAQPLRADRCAIRPTRSAGSSTTCAASTAATWSAACCRRAGPVTIDAQLPRRAGRHPDPGDARRSSSASASAPHDGSVKYRFVSDHAVQGPRGPSARRFRARPLAALRRDPEASRSSRSPARCSTAQVRPAAPGA